MITCTFCFIGVQETIVIGIVTGISILLIGLMIFALLKYKGKATGQSNILGAVPGNQMNKLHDESFKAEDFRNYYPVREGSKISLIQFNDIVDFTAGNNYVFLTDSKGKDYLVEASLTELESKLPKEFLRVHKSTIVNSKLIGEIKKLGNGRYDLIMKCDKSRIISCSKSYNENIKSIIDF